MYTLNQLLVYLFKIIIIINSYWRERLCNHYTSLPLIEAFGKGPDKALSHTYTTWLLNWRSYMTDASYRVMVPPEAAVVTTPLRPHNWLELLSTFPNQDLKEFFINGLLHGFKIGFKNPLSQLRSSKKNLLGALQHPQVVDDYLQAEIAEHRVIGPFQMEDIPAAHISRFGVIPKHHSPNKWRLIVDLSHPASTMAYLRTCAALPTSQWIQPSIISWSWVLGPCWRKLTSRVPFACCQSTPLITTC